MSNLIEWGESVQSSGLGVALSESTYAFPIIEGIHLLGLAVSVGLIFLTDLRLLGLLMRNIPIAVVLRQLRTYALAGFVLVFLSGGLLFWSEAPTLLASPAFPFKLLFIALAGANALYFEFVIARRPWALDERSGIAPGVRRAGWASLVLWTLVIICGRLIPYLPTWA